MAKKHQGQEINMRKTREILRLKLTCQLSNREIARSCAVSHPTVIKYAKAAEQAKMTYEQIKGLDDRTLFRLLKANYVRSVRRRVVPQPNWGYIHHELKKKGVTLALLWQEYKEIYPDGYQSSQFCEYYHRWRKKLKISMRQTHKAGEKMFVDYAGQTIPIHNRYTGKIHQASIFVAVLGASNYTYAEASWDQRLNNWIDSHIRAYEYFGGVTKLTIPDNLRTGIKKACRYEPELNPTYNDMAIHYGTAVVPCRVQKPQDKAKVEVGVQIVGRWILAKLRKRTFFSLRELNQAIWELLKELNQRQFQKLKGSRLSVFEEIEKKVLLPLPIYRYEVAEWKKAKINIDYHVELEGHYYSVPYALKEKQESVMIKYTAKTVEIFHKDKSDKRIVTHKRNYLKGHHTTIREHMPESHRRYLEWTPSRIINWATQTGKSTARMVEQIINSRQHPEQGYRSCLGILRLAKKYSSERLEAACSRALSFNAYSYKSVRSILEKGLDQGKENELCLYPDINHENIRGNEYFHNQKEVN